jgi:hypothetical protein
MRSEEIPGDFSLFECAEKFRVSDSEKLIICWSFRELSIWKTKKRLTNSWKQFMVGFFGAVDCFSLEERKLVEK